MSRNPNEFYSREDAEAMADELADRQAASAPDNREAEEPISPQELSAKRLAGRLAEIEEYCGLQEACDEIKAHIVYWQRLAVGKSKRGLQGENKALRSRAEAAEQEAERLRQQVAEEKRLYAVLLEENGQLHDEHLKDDTEAERLRKALEKYGRHALHKCLYEAIDVEGEIAPQWRHRGKITECRCGLAQALAQPQEPAK